MRRVILNKITKRSIWGLSFIFVSYLFLLLGINRAMLNIKFGFPALDFVYVLFVTFLPYLISGIGYGILFSVAFLLLRYFILPVHKLERHYMGIKRANFVKSIFFIAVIVFFLFVIPYFNLVSSPIGDAVTSIEQSIMGIDNLVAAMGGYVGLVFGTISLIISTIFSSLFIKPFYLFYPVRIDAFLCAIFLSPLFYHTVIVGFSKKHVLVARHVSTHLCQEGEKIVLRTTLRSPFPAPTISLPSSKIARGKRMGQKRGSNKSLLCTSVENKEELTLQEGYYNFDIVPISIFTFPFFHTNVYKVCDMNSDVSVIPRLRYKTRILIRRPSVVRETGTLVRKQLGSSLDFAGMREYTREDPLSRIWWKGLAKHGELLVKQFHSFSEDRWMLVLDFTNQNLGEESVKSMLSFARLFIELCTRKDIAVGLSSFSPTFHYIDYEVKKRVLLSSLTKVTTPLYEISPKGIEMIMHDALGPDIEKLKIKCRKKKMTLSTVYSYSGLGKQKTFFSWHGEKTFKNCMKQFFKNMRKSGKIVLVTDGDPKNIDMFKKFKTICENRHCSYLLVLTESQGDMQNQLKGARIKSIFAPYEKLAKPNFVIGLVSLV